MLALAIAGCKVKRPDDVIPESKMEDILYDYHIAKAMGENLPYNENYKKSLYIDAVLRNTVLQKLCLIHQWFGIHVIQRFYRKSMKR